MANLLPGVVGTVVVLVVVDVDVAARTTVITFSIQTL